MQLSFFPLSRIILKFFTTLTSENVGAWINHSTAGNIFIARWILTTIQLIHYHLPDSVTSCWTRLQVAMTSVRHTEVHCVGPEWRIVEWSGDGRVVEESLLLHHRELIVAANAQIWSTKSHDRVVGDVGELFHYDSLTSHLFCPCVNCRIRPESLIVVVAGWMKWILNAINFLFQNFHIAAEAAEGRRRRR